MVTFRITTASDRRMLCTTAARLIFSTAAVSLTLAAADAQAARAHLSNDLQRHLDSGDTTGTTVIVSGSAERVAAIAARHVLRTQ